jgi:tetratricopeptide (TPR) repeat protein
MERLLRLSTFLIIVLVFLYTPFKRGLFFDSDFYLYESILILLFCINALWYLVKKPSQINTFYLSVFLIPATHLLSLTRAESPQGALDNLLRWTTYSCFFVMLLWMKKSDTTKRIASLLPYIFHTTGIVISFFALFGLWGWVDFKDLYLGKRLTGTFQYPNTFATVISAFWLFSLIMLSRKHQSHLSTAFYGLPLVAFGVSFFFSYSRGVMLLFPFVWLIGLCLLRGKHQLSYFLTSLFSVATSLLVFIQMSNQLTSGTSSPGVYIFIISTVLLTALIVGLRTLLHSQWKLFDKTEPYIRLILPAVVILLGIGAGIDLQNKGLVYQQLPESMQKRIEDINFGTDSVLGRTNVYEDALRISIESPLLGFGGEAWKILYPRYQSVPYLNNEVHNGYLEVLISNGWLGVIIFIGLFTTVLFIVFRHRKHNIDNEKYVLITACVTALSMLFMHGFIDFDFSFGTVWFIIFWLLSMACPESPYIINNNKEFTLGINKVGITLFHGVLILTTIVVASFGIRFFYADQQIKSLLQFPSLKEAQQVYERIMSINPYNSSYYIQLAYINAQENKRKNQQNLVFEVEKYLKKAEMLEPNNSINLLGIGNMYVLLGNFEKADWYLRKAQQLDRFNVKIYDSIIQLESQIAVNLMQAKKKTEAVKWATRSLQDYHHYRNTVDPFININIPDKRSLELDKSTHLLISKSYLIIGQYQTAIDHLSTINDQNDFNIVKTAYAIRVVANEALGQQAEAGRLTKIMLQRSSDFPQSVVVLRSLVGQ